MTLRIIMLFSVLPLAAQAEVFSIKEITYAEIEEFVSGVIDFEDNSFDLKNGLPPFAVVTFGERFSGQTLKHKQDFLLDWHNVLDDETPDSPVIAVPATHGPVIQADDHWGSMALFPIGPSIGPYPDRDLGRGTLAMSFDPPICFFAFRTAIDGMTRYRNVNETALRDKPQSTLNIRFYDEEGRELASFIRSRNAEGPIELGFMQSGQAEAQIAGVFLQGLDLWGFSIDDIRFDPSCPLKLF